MKIIKIFVIFISVIFIPVVAFSQDDSLLSKVDTIRTPADTIYFAGYRAVNISIQYEENWTENEWEIYLCDKKLLTSFRWGFPGVGLYNHFGENAKNPCYIQDINQDGKGEMAFEVAGGGNNGWESTFIYSLDTTANEILILDGLNKGLNGAWLYDLDGDKIPEWVANDMNYECWHYGCSNSPAPYLAWKWDGSVYKIANYKLGKQILEKLNKIELDSIGISKFISNPDSSKGRQCWYPKDEYSFPESMFDEMMAFIYCGMPEIADSIFNTACPSNVEGNPELYKEIMDKIHSSPWWPELQHSNW